MWDHQDSHQDTTYSPRISKHTLSVGLQRKKIQWRRLHIVWRKRQSQKIGSLRTQSWQMGCFVWLDWQFPWLCHWLSKDCSEKVLRWWRYCGRLWGNYSQAPKVLIQVQASQEGLELQDHQAPLQGNLILSLTDLYKDFKVKYTRPNCFQTFISL